jgi:hypothetical protein
LTCGIEILEASQDLRTELNSGETKSALKLRRSMKEEYLTGVKQV